MSSTVKLSLKLKERLEKLRAQFTLKGKRLKQEELLEILIGIGEVSPILLEREIYRPLSSEDRKKILEDTYDLGTSSESNIDIDIYSD